MWINGASASSCRSVHNQMLPDSREAAIINEAMSTTQGSGSLFSRLLNGMRERRYV